MPSPLSNQIGSNQVWLADAADHSSTLHSDTIIPFGIPDLDKDLPLGGLSLGKVHEWFSLGHPPCSILCALATQALLHKKSQREAFFVLWIGKSVWPLPQFLNNSFSAENSYAANLLLQRSIFVDVNNHKQILWAYETALKSKQVAAVISYCPKVSLQQSRRLALAAEKAAALGLIIRPFKERLQLSAAASRWLVTPRASASDHLVQQLELLSHKGPQSLKRKWHIEVRYDHYNSSIDLRLHILSAMDSRANQTKDPQTNQKTHQAA